MAIFKKENGQLVDFSNPIPDTSIAPIENGATSTHNYVVGAYALVKGILKKVTNAISIGTAFSDSNSETTDVATELKELNDDVTTINTQLSDLKMYNQLGTINGLDALIIGFNSGNSNFGFEIGVVWSDVSVLLVRVKTNGSWNAWYKLQGILA
jgi:hypothetical protein